MMLSILTLSLAGATPPGGPPNLGAVPKQIQYKRIDDDGGPVVGRWRRSRARWRAWELRDDTIVRLQDTSRGRVIEDRRFDATGYPLTTWHSPGTDRSAIVVHTLPTREVGLSGWKEHPIPGGTATAPLAPFERIGGGAELLILGGIFEVWYEPDTVDVYGDVFRDGLQSGCGCVIVDEAATWIDNRPAKRFRLDMPGPDGRVVMDLWALPVGDRGTWLANYRVVAPSDDVLALAPGRAMVGTIRLDALDELMAPAGDAPTPSDAP